jgi:hypothetical protein
MQELIVLILVFVAGCYVFRRVKKTLSVGEEDRTCSHCPVNVTKLKTPQK